MYVHSDGTVFNLFRAAEAAGLAVSSFRDSCGTNCLATASEQGSISGKVANVVDIVRKHTSEKICLLSATLAVGNYWLGNYGAGSPSPETRRHRAMADYASPEAAWMILTNVGFKDAPPTRKPSMSGHPMSSTQLSGVTDPPY